MINDTSAFVNLYNDINLITPTKNPRFISHYTSPQGLKGIIENSSLHFTDRNFLNDSSEGIYVLDLISDNLEYICDDISFIKPFIKEKCNEYKEKAVRNKFHTYQCSFSKNKDSLCMWNYYTKGDTIKGYSVNFNRELLIKSLRTKTPKGNEGLRPYFGLVIYNKKRQLEIVKGIIHKFTEGCEKDFVKRGLIISLIMEKILDNGAFFKKPCFDIEEEYRIVFVTVLTEKLEHYGIPSSEKFKEKNGYFLPYIERNFSPNSIKETVFSPTLDNTFAKESLYRLLVKDYSHVKTLPSDIPVRY